MHDSNCHCDKSNAIKLRVETESADPLPRGLLIAKNIVALFKNYAAFFITVTRLGREGAVACNFLGCFFAIERRSTEVPQRLLVPSGEPNRVRYLGFQGLLTLNQLEGRLIVMAGPVFAQIVRENV